MSAKSEQGEPDEQCRCAIQINPAGIRIEDRAFDHQRHIADPLLIDVDRPDREATLAACGTGSNPSRRAPRT
jgi:hypothetical protein